MTTLTDYLQPSKAEEVNRMCGVEMRWNVHARGFLSRTDLNANSTLAERRQFKVTESLDACRLLRESLTDEGEVFDFVYHLNDCVGLVSMFGPAWIREPSTFALLNATPQQIACAFLLTKGRIGGEG